MKSVLANVLFNSSEHYMSSFFTSMLEIENLSLDQIRMSLSSRSIIYVFFISVIFCVSAGLVYFTVYKKIVAKKFEIEEATEDIFANLDLHMLNGHFFVFQTKIYQFFN